MKIVNTLESSHISQMKELYRSAFPKAERKSFWLMKRKCRQGKMEMLSLESDAGEFLGLAVTAFYKDMALLDYFAVNAGERGNGVGSEAFEMLKKRYADRRFFLEIEIPDSKAQNAEQRMRRKGFYLRNGMTETGILVVLFGIEMELLTDHCQLNFKEYHELYEKQIGRLYARQIKKFPK